MGVYGAKRRTGEAIAEFFRFRFPWVVRRYFVFVLAAYALMGLGVLTGYRMTLADPEQLLQHRRRRRGPGAQPRVVHQGAAGDPLQRRRGAAVVLRHLSLHPQLPGGHALLRGGLRRGRAGDLPAVHQRPHARGDGGALPDARPGSGVLGLGDAARRHRAERHLPVRRGRHGDRLVAGLPRPPYAAAQPRPARAGGGAAGGGRGHHVPGGGADRGDLPPDRARRRRPLEPRRHDAGLLDLVLPLRRARP